MPPRFRGDARSTFAVATGTGASIGTRGRCWFEFATRRQQSGQCPTVVVCAWFAPGSRCAVARGPERHHRTPADRAGAPFFEHVSRATRRSRRHDRSVGVFAVIIPSATSAELEQRRDLLGAILRDYDVVDVGGDDEGPAVLVLCDDLARPEHAAAIAARLDARLDTTAPIAGAPADGVGIVLHNGGWIEPQVLVAAAIQAGRRALQGGSAYVFSDPAHGLAAGVAAEESHRLRDAVDAGELVLHYQPKIEIGSNRLVGFEALVRWPRADRVVPPNEFIPVAEQSDLIERLGAWVLREASLQLARWRAERDLPEQVVMCVNVSGRQFTPRLADTVTAAISVANIGAESLVLEVTETVVMADVDVAVDTLRALKRVGIQVAIDDFGTGYSSLAYLKRLPIDELKIDRAFVDGLGREPEDTAIAGAVVALAHALDLVVIAEGVETEVQLRSLESLGCDLAQGYLFARPAPAEALAELLRPPFLIPPGATDGGHTSRTAPLVVVADDAPDVRQLASVSLSTAGFEVHEAATGDAALAAARELRPDCVLLDLSMPGLSGLDTCRALRADPLTAGCVVVVLTSHASAEDKIAAFSAGADDYMVKPFGPRDLAGRVRDALRRREGERQ